MRFPTCMALLALFLPAAAGAQTATPDPGIPLEVAEARAARISALIYTVALTVPEAVSAPLEGVNVLSFQLKTAADPLVIDFATSREHVRSVTANKQPTEFAWDNGHIVVPAAALRVGHNEIAIDFKAGDASLNRNPDFLYALFVPARAHLA